MAHARTAVTLVNGSEDGRTGRVANQLAFPGTAFRTRGSGADAAHRLVDHLGAEERSGAEQVVMSMTGNADSMVALVVLDRLQNDEPLAARSRVHHVVSVVGLRELAELVLGSIDDAFLQADRMAMLLETGSVIAVEGLHAAPARLRSRVAGFIRRCNPLARLIDVDDIAGPGDLPSCGVRVVRELTAGPRWMRAIADPEPSSDDATTPKPDADGFDEFVYRGTLPFHPERLWRTVGEVLVPEQVGRVYRSRGFVQFATRADRVGSWSSLGAMLALDPTAMSTSSPESALGQSIWFLGTDLDRECIVRGLDAATLTMDEFDQGPTAWASYPDPFPSWTAAIADSTFDE
jgi:G3E family GTPase